MKTSFQINMFGVPDTIFCTNQFLPGIKEIICIRQMTVTGRLFQGLDDTGFYYFISWLDLHAEYCLHCNILFKTKKLDIDF